MVPPVNMSATFILSFLDLHFELAFVLESVVQRTSDAFDLHGNSVEDLFQHSGAVSDDELTDLPLAYLVDDEAFVDGEEPIDGSLLLVDGEGALITDTEEYKLSKGNFFVTGPNIYHKQSTNPKKPLTEYYLYIQTSDKKTNNALVSTFLSNHFYFCRNCEMLSLVERIIQESNVKKWGYENIIAALMQILLTEITRLYWPDFRVTNKSAENLNDRRFILIEQAFINDPEGITLTKLSGTIGLCERQTQRLLEKYYGMSFLQKKAESIKR